MYSTHLFELRDTTQCVLVRNTERKHDFCLFTRKLRRASLSKEYEYFLQCWAANALVHAAHTQLLQYYSLNKKKKNEKT